MTTKDQLARAIDDLPEQDAYTVLRFIEFLRLSRSDPVLTALVTAPEDDEPLTDEEAAALATPPRRTIQHDDLKRELGLM